VSAPVDALILDLLEWIGPEPRAYSEVMEAWRTSCPRLPVWEEVNERGLVERHHREGLETFISVTVRGWELLGKHRPHRPAGALTKVRAFQPGDEAALWQIYYRSIHETASADYTPEQVNVWAPSVCDLPKWAALIQRLAPFVALRGEEIVGYADVQPSGYIDHFFVSPSFGRQGVGTFLMRRIHEAALHQGIDHLFSNVSITARRFFEKWDFAVEQAQTVHIQGVALNNYRMSKVLSANV
jgi:putative acetyltransferase